MNRRILAMIPIFLLASVLAADRQPSGIAGRIEDSQGAAIAKARVLIHWDAAGSTVGLVDNIGIQNDMIVKTEASGAYSAPVPPGFYDVFVSATGFTPTASKTRVKQRQWATYNSSLQPDPQVLRELAH